MGGASATKNPVSCHLHKSETSPPYVKTVADVKKTILHLFDGCDVKRTKGNLATSVMTLCVAADSHYVAM